MSTVPVIDLSLDELSTTLSYVALGVGAPLDAPSAEKAAPKKVNDYFVVSRVTL